MDNRDPSLPAPYVSRYYCVPLHLRFPPPPPLSGVDVRKVRECIGDTDKDEDNPLLKAEQAAQVRAGSAGESRQNR